MRLSQPCSQGPLRQLGIHPHLAEQRTQSSVAGGMLSPCTHIRRTVDSHRHAPRLGAAWTGPFSGNTGIQTMTGDEHRQPSEQPDDRQWWLSTAVKTPPASCGC